MLLYWRASTQSTPANMSNPSDPVRRRGQHRRPRPREPAQGRFCSRNYRRHRLDRAAPPTANIGPTAAALAAANPIAASQGRPRQPQHLPTSTQPPRAYRCRRPMSQDPPPRWGTPASRGAGDDASGRGAPLQSLQLDPQTPAAGDLPARVDHTVWNHFYGRLAQSEDPPFTFKVMVISTFWPGATPARSRKSD